MWTDLEIDGHAECSMSDGEKQTLYINSSMWNIGKWYR